LNAAVPNAEKTAAMMTVKILRTNPDLSDSHESSVQTLMNNPNYGIVTSGINLIMTMIKHEPKLAKSWSQHGMLSTKRSKSHFRFR
jgi:hypothetical protein